MFLTPFVHCHCCCSFKFGLVFFLSLLVKLQTTFGHGILAEPPQRSSLWRFGYPYAPKNYDDFALNCGGRGLQYDTNDGKCGVCGDPWDGMRENEAGGIYANGIIGRTYTEGNEIAISVRLSISHLGFFEFRICPNNDVHRAVTQQCLDQNLLTIKETNSTRYMPGHRHGDHNFTLVLPSHLTCSQCVIQWIYKTGNSWGLDTVTNISCIGCGAQEYFVNCADVAICRRYDSACKSSVRKTRHRDENHAILRASYNHANADLQTNSRATQNRRRQSYILPEEMFENRPTTTITHVAPSPLRTASLRTAQPITDNLPQESRHTVLEQDQNYKAVKGKRTRIRSTMKQGRKRMSSDPSSQRSKLKSLIQNILKTLKNGGKCPCIPTPAYYDVYGMWSWCSTHCPIRACPKSHCVCACRRK